ncbi:FGGY family carbohydrate kinase [Aquamicrobium segne]|uniref:ATP:glycerol 3-phosphotransferase n=1 Tax=Aquamicrobium segne TaxID=469547 RepID=A0ABW0H0E5_9HYPH
MKKTLAIDQGTTSTRAFVADETGIHCVHTVEHRQYYPHSGHVEHDPEELLKNIRACLDAAPHIDCVGIANQGESCLAWDARTGRAITPVIVWQDDRTADICDQLHQQGFEPMVRERAGLPIDPYFSGSKLGWILQHVPEAQKLSQTGNLRLGTTDAFFRDRLTGNFVTDPTTASRTSLMNLHTRQWDAELCRIFSVPIEALPQICPTGGQLGNLPNGVPLTASIVDQQAALFGHGARLPGHTKITFGTGAFVLTLTDTLYDGGPLLPTIAWAEDGAQPMHALDGGVYTASSAVNWSREIGLFDDWTQIDHFSSEPAISRGLVFVPALAGLAAPHWDRHARGAWFGLGLDTSRSDMMQAVLEGIAFRVGEILAEMEKQVAIVAPISIDGGMSRNPWFCQFVADCLGRQISVSGEAELTALGCAQLAARGASSELPYKPAARIIEPRPFPADWVAIFQAARQASQQFGLAAI